MEVFRIRKPGFPVKPTSKLKIKKIADAFRAYIVKHIGPYETFCPIVEALEMLGEKPFKKYAFAILSDDDPRLNKKWAFTSPTEKCIYISESVYNNACRNIPKDRFTIAHELGHLLLGHKFDMVFSRKNENTPIPCYRDSEWQADTFAAYLLMPTELAKDKTADEIKELFGVSTSAAIAREARLKHDI